MCIHRERKIVRIVAVIPCLNEEKTIADIVSRTQKYCERVIVVDNNSSDNTRLTLERILPFKDILSCYKRGVGKATSHGFIYSLENSSYDVIVTLDGDGQHNPDEIPEVIKPILENKVDLVIGSRFMKEYNVPKYRKFGIDVITWLYNLRRKHRIADSQSCFRAYTRSLLQNILPIQESGFAYSIETLIKASSKGYRITEVPISCIYHKDYRQNSSKNPISHGLSVMFSVLKWRWKLEVIPNLR